MKKVFKTAVVMLLIGLLCAFPVSSFLAETIFTADGFSYTLLNDNFVSIYGWDGGSDTLIIPNMLDQSYVREIQNNCFLYRDDFTTLNLSRADYLNRIGVDAFKGSAVSGKLSIPPQVRTVASGAFENCDGIEILYYNAMSDVVSSQCFYDCDSLTEAYIADGVARIEQHAFSECDSLSIIRIPHTVTAISTSAFFNCPNVVIYCYTDSYAYQYAVENGFEYVLIDAPEPPTEPETDEPTSEPETDAPTSGPVEVTYIVGDADGDSWITIIDATVIQRVLVELRDDPDGMIALRGSSDGEELNVMHATKIQRYLADFVVAEPIGEEVTVLFAGVTTV